MESVTVSAFTAFIATKADLYDTLVRNGFYLPKATSSIVTEQYLQDIMSKTIKCPLYEEVRLKPCPQTPSKHLLIEKLKSFEVTNGLSFGIREGALPDKNWLTTILSTYTPSDEIFGKSYRPPPRKAAATEQKVM